MPLYKDMYLRLFNQVTDAIREIEAADFAAAYEKLKKAQLETEKMYMESDEES